MDTGQKETRFFYSCSKGDTCQFRHEPAALTNETVSARSLSVKRWMDSPVTSDLPRGEIMREGEEMEKGKKGE